jgi:hypothetical protein
MKRNGKSLSGVYLKATTLLFSKSLRSAAIDFESPHTIAGTRDVILVFFLNRLGKKHAIDRRKPAIDLLKRISCPSKLWK